MTENEKGYRSLAGSIGLTLIIFIILLNVLTSISYTISYVFGDYMSEMGATVFSEISYFVAYLASFMLPVGFFYLIYGKHHKFRMFLEPILPGKMTFVYVFAGIALIYAASYVNGLIVSVFDYSTYSQDVLWEEQLTHGYDIVLLFISTALVPAFCEEFLFRGMILTNLLPYGKSNAIVLSALLFGLMHSNSEQYLYTVVAGLVMGYVYVKTRSIWASTLMHFFNNFISVLQSVIYEKADPYIADVVTTIIDCAIFIVGTVFIFIIIKNIKKPVVLKAKKEKFVDGCFEREACDDTEDLIISGRRGFKLFFTPSVIIFIVLSAITALFYIISAMTYEPISGIILGFINYG